jgi:hypothetical protein
MVYIYALLLETNKYYIGKTENPKFRIDSQFNGNGTYWTKKYKPIQIIEVIPNCNNFDEDKYTLTYMEKYGIHNVRGGSFCQMVLPNDKIQLLTQMIHNATDTCFICGSKGHYANKCNIREVPLNKQVISMPINEVPINEPINEVPINEPINEVPINEVPINEQINEINKKCNCIMSVTFPHRKKKCSITNTLFIK